MQASSEGGAGGGAVSLGMERGGAAGTGLDDLGPMRLGMRMEQRATVKQQVQALRSRLDRTSNDLQVFLSSVPVGRFPTPPPPPFHLSCFPGPSTFVGPKCCMKAQQVQAFRSRPDCPSNHLQVQHFPVLILCPLPLLQLLTSIACNEGVAVFHR